MKIFDLHVISIPDLKTQTAVAKIITETSPGISMDTAMDMVKKPPLLLYRNLEFKDARQHMEKLKRMGILCRPTESKDVPAQAVKETEQSDADDPVAAYLRTASTGTEKRVHTGANPRDFQSGLRVGSIALSDFENIEKKSKKQSVQATIIVIAIFIILGLLVYLLPQQHNRFATGTSAPARETQAANESHASDDLGTVPQQDQPGQPQNRDRLRREITPTQKRQSSAYIDSARTCGANMEKCIAFYRAAISFNRFNLAAWQGLLQAYRDLQMTSEAIETKERMRALFGDEVMDVTSLIGTFGELIDAYKNDDGTYRVEYKTQRHSKDDILREVFNMTRAVRTACMCQNISIFAVTGAGRGLLAHSTPQTSVHTLSAFSRQAEVVWLE
jgi:hypothetical protein